MRRSLLALLLMIAAPVRAEVPSIAAAADLRQALTIIAAGFEKQTGEKVVLVFGASGNLARQLQQGAPHSLFLSADEDYAFRLADAGLTEGRGQRYAIGRLALVARKGGPVDVRAGLAGLKKKLSQGRVRHVAIANPAFAPYGKRAEEALTTAGIFPAQAERLVLGENVSQALQFVLSGAAEAGVVSDALTYDPAVRAQLDVHRLSQITHSPLYQRLVIMKGAGPVARRFAVYVLGPPGRAVLRRHGFGLPALPLAPRTAPTAPR